MGPLPYDHNKRLLTLTVITLSGFRCNPIFIELPHIHPEGVETSQPAER